MGTARKSDRYFNKYGFPNFEPYSAGKVFNIISDDLVGHGSQKDFSFANKKLLTDLNMKGKVRPASSDMRIEIKDKNGNWLEYTWHHHEDGITLQPILTEIHNNIAHTGGSSIIAKYLKNLFEYK